MYKYTVWSEISGQTLWDTTVFVEIKIALDQHMWGQMSYNCGPFVSSIAMIIYLFIDYEIKNVVRYMQL